MSQKDVTERRPRAGLRIDQGGKSGRGANKSRRVVASGHFSRQGNTVLREPSRAAAAVLRQTLIAAEAEAAEAEGYNEAVESLNVASAAPGLYTADTYLMMLLLKLRELIPPEPAPSDFTRMRAGRILRNLGPSDRVSVKIHRRMQDREHEEQERERQEFLATLKEIHISGEFTIGSVDLPSQAPVRVSDPVALTELVMQSSTWLRASEVSARAGLSNKNPSSTPNKWKRGNTIFAINHQGQDRYPSYALGVDGKPLPVMKDILQVFSGKKAPLLIGLWFCSVNSWLGGVAPKDAIETRPQDVLNAAVMEVTPIEHG